MNKINKFLSNSKNWSEDFYVRSNEIRVLGTEFIWKTLKSKILFCFQCFLNFFLQIWVLLKDRIPEFSKNFSGLFRRNLLNDGIILKRPWKSELFFVCHVFWIYSSKSKATNNVNTRRNLSNIVNNLPPLIRTNRTFQNFLRLIAIHNVLLCVFESRFWSWLEFFFGVMS